MITVIFALLFQEKPFTIKKEGVPSEFEGFVPDLLKKIEPLINAKFEIKHVGDFKYGTKDQNGQWNGMIGELVNQVSYSVLGELVNKVSYSVLGELVNKVSYRG
jgi:hypothetical protein